MKQYSFEAEITGTCSIYINAESKEEALEKIGSGWKVLEGSEEWQCELDDWKNPENSFLDESEIETNKES